MSDYRVYTTLKKLHLELSDRVYPVINDSDYSVAIAFTGHNASVTVAKGKNVLEVLELERFINLKNADYSIKVWREPHSSEYSEWNEKVVRSQLKEVQKYLSRKYTQEFAVGIFVDRLMLPGVEIKLDEYFNAKKWYRESHHLSHGAGAFYQSPYDKALVFTIDGGSIDGNTTAGIYERGKPIQWLPIGDTSLGRTYYKFGRLLKDIKYTVHGQSVTYPGKLMGYAGLGVPDNELVEVLVPLFLVDFMKKIEYSGIFKQASKKIKIISELENPFTEKRIEGEEAYTLAASVQLAFEEAAIKLMLPYIKMYPELPICISGGCALNISFNTRLVKEIDREVFVPPDPTDCGLSFGAMLNYIKPDKVINDPYLGPELLDRDSLATYLYEENGVGGNYNVSEASPKDVASLIAKGKILGICQGRSERGPRALGNRSIICSVKHPDMKDIINAKVKHREWYRPFSPIVRLEDVSLYFDWDRESRFMTFSPQVREQYKDKIKPVVHYDGTARVQTITREQNQFIYDVLTELDKATGIGMILNTSFNVDGKPIVSTIKDAFKVLKTTELDGIFIDGTLIMKKS
jgi:carbamoyltransferase